MTLTLHQLIEPHQANLKLTWIVPAAVPDRLLDDARLQHESHGSIGYLNPVRPSLITIVGHTETNYLEALGPNSRSDALDRLAQQQPWLVIVADGLPVPNDLRERAREHDLPLMVSPLPAARILEHLQYAVSAALAEKKTLHGVFMEVMGLGVLLTGPSGVGKSELALELLGRGHRLVADDAPEFRRTSPDAVHGYCPPLLADFIEVRGLGILNVRAMYGNHAVLEHKRLHLIIDLQPADVRPEDPADRLGHAQRERDVLGVAIPEVRLALAPGRDLSVLIEAAVRNHVLRLSGYNAAEDFMQRQRQAMEPPEP